jgi:hypothetical protein
VSRADAGAAAGAAVDGDQASDLPPRPRLARSSVFGALRRGIADFYFNSVRLVPANLIWGGGVLVLAWVAMVLGLLPALALSPLLGIPLVGVYRIAGHIVRGEDAVLSDAFRAMRERTLAALLLAGVFAWAGVLLAINVRLGLGAGTVVGWGFATFAGWALLALVCIAIVVWPIVADPDRRDLSVVTILKLAGYVVLARPVVMMVLALVVVVLGIVSTIAFAAIVTISVAYLALVSSRVVLPEADWIAERLAARDAAS